MNKLIILIAVIGLAAAAPRWDDSYEFDDDDYHRVGHAAGATVYSSHNPVYHSARSFFYGANDDDDDDDDARVHYFAKPSVSVRQANFGVQTYSAPHTVSHTNFASRYTVDSDEDDDDTFRYFVQPPVATAANVHTTYSAAHPAVVSTGQQNFQYFGQPAVVAGTHNFGVQTYSSPSVGSVAIHGAPQAAVYNVQQPAAVHTYAQPATVHTYAQPATVHTVAQPTVYSTSSVVPHSSASFFSSGVPLFRSAASPPTHFYSAAAAPPTYYSAPVSHGSYYVSVNNDVDVDDDRFDFD